MYEYLISQLPDNNIYLDFRWDIWYNINWYNNVALTDLQEYHESIDIENIIKTVKNDKIQKIINSPINRRKSIANIEKQIKVIRCQILESLNKLNIPENQFKNIIDLKLINEGQLGHLLYMIGFRTDIDDKTIPKIIENNYINGIKTDIDFIAENLSDKKSKVFNRSLMSQTQYSNRKIQLASYNLKYIHKGDCGTNQYVEFFVAENKAKALIGKYIVVGDDIRNIKLITNDNYHEYIDKVVKLRSPLKCLYKNGTCEICGGKLIKYYINRLFNVGHSSVLIFTNSTSQNVLSAKHFQNTTSKEYIIPFELQPYFDKKGRLLYIKNKINLDGFKIGFNIKDARKLLNISDNSSNIDQDDIVESNFGTYHHLILRKNDNDITDSDSTGPNVGHMSVFRMET
jgi:hypothetical protein